MIGNFGKICPQGVPKLGSAFFIAFVAFFFVLYFVYFWEVCNRGSSVPKRRIVFEFDLLWVELE